VCMQTKDGFVGRCPIPSQWHQAMTLLKQIRDSLGPMEHSLTKECQFETWSRSE